MKFIDRCSIKTQWTLLMLGIIIAVLLLNGGLFALYDLAQFRREKARELEVLGRLLAERSGSVLASQDVSAATRMLEGVRSIPAIQIAALYTADGKLFARYLNGRSPTALPAQIPFNQVGSMWLHHIAPVRWKGRTQGYVYLRASLLGWRERILRYARVGGSVILLSLGFSVIVVALLQRRMTRSLDRMRQVARSVAETHDYTVRVPVEGPVELRELAATFNEMLRRVQEHQAVLVAAKEAAEEMMRLKSTFLANMNHEIRTPLAGIMGYAQILEEELTEPMHREMAQVIRQSGQRLLDTLDSLMYLSYLEAGTLQLDQRSQNVASLTRAVMDELEPLARAKQLIFTFQCSDPGLTACVDEGVWTRLVKHLVHNAIKFTKEGDVTVLLEGDDATVQLQVVDTGIGISEEQQSVIFEAFKQASDGLSRDYEGSGLGLAIVQRIVRLLDGQIYVESQPGIGSIFTVIIPRSRPENESSSRAAPDDAAQARA